MRLRLRTVAVFAAGYVLGTKAGRERYAQMVEGVQRVAREFQERQAARVAEQSGPKRPRRSRAG
ncbi:hypothetical protein SAMN05421678_103252 [Actinopolymorpha cephalotaxi]|uniref:DNA polymerase I-like protein with 3'-5' exonuclease and polymerase domains n=1 Tax=Actinopolymorpha cephalotaxi TaxID=504797 RepID=A0A1I2N7H3_9ACTN|nr:DNA polymerase I-like protein with 3'-5' exonuclease and polymerase domains [Actinopolymorpha cephalotaxi]SFF99865.1 hypothetical protein SAMN05421678_103252 [Actinopolymorpha cephalotaxi]